MTTETLGRTRGSSTLRFAAILLPLGSAPAMAGSAGFIPFGAFVAGLSTASVSPQAAKPSSKVASPATVETMRKHLLGLYSGMTVNHSYMLADHAYDCVPVMQQPSVKALGLKTLPTAPAMPSTQAAVPPAADALPVGTAGSRGPDAYGNATVCESGTIPMRRVSLDDMARFDSLAAFFRKSPVSGQAPQRPDPVVPAAANDVHKYSYGYQYVTNFGGSTDINVWSPKVDTSQGEVFSLSQFWYINTTGPTQTVEGGAQVYPDLYGTDQASLFVYWTSDDYNQVGCYNLTCPGFVQTSNAYELGGPFPRYSTLLGQQYYARMSAVKQGGDWWIYIGGIDPSHALGYYPAAVFNGRPITTSANLIEYGGEVVGSTVWPQMGSGSYAQARFRHAASQKQISYLDPSYAPVQANLYAQQPSIGCYTNVTNDNSGYNGWNSFFYFGGPGGSGC